MSSTRQEKQRLHFREYVYGPRGELGQAQTCWTIMFLKRIESACSYFLTFSLGLPTKPRIPIWFTRRFHNRCYRTTAVAGCGSLEFETCVGIVLPFNLLSTLI